MPFWKTRKPPTPKPETGLAFPETERWQTWEGNRVQVFERMLAPFRGQPVRFLEIGSFEGASAIWMLQNILTHPDARITCVDDNSLGRKDRLIANLAHVGQQDRATLLWIGSHEVRAHVPDAHFDFVYVDASHAAPNVLFDVVNAYLTCKPGGLIGCDDYGFTVPEHGSVPKPAIDAFLQLMGDRVEVVERDYQLWFRKRA